ncbi:MAG TPA: hypothetical protein VJB15_06855, partial [Rhodothermia bacterium]|nr:hypothetical protein [Rhodothermia bacterium]
MRSILIIAAVTASAIILFANASLERVPRVFGPAPPAEGMIVSHNPSFSPKGRESAARSRPGRLPDASTSRTTGTPPGAKLTSDWVALDTLTGDLRLRAVLSTPLTPRRAELLAVDSLNLAETRADNDSTLTSSPSVDDDEALPRARYRAVDSVSIRLASDAELTTLPNRTLTAVFAVTNSGHRSRNVLAYVDVPAGWIVVRAPSTLELAPASTTIQFVTLKIPSDAPAGNAEVGFGLEDGESRTFLASATILMTVETVREITLDLQSQPDFVAAGETYEVTFALGNYGNVRTTAKLEVDAASMRDVSLSAHQVDLEPGESREIRAAVKTQSGLLRPVTKRFRVSVEADGHPAMRAVASSGVDVIPVYGRV